MRIRLLGAGIVAAVALAGCTADAEPTPTPTGAGSSPVDAAVRVDIGGGQAYGLTVTDTAIWATSFDAGTLVRVDPESNKAETVSVGAAASVVADGDRLWVAGYAGPGQPGTIARVDGGAVTAKLNPGEVCCDLSVGGGLLWAADPAGYICGIDPATTKVAHRYPVPMDRNVHINAVYGGDSVWVASDTGPLHRVNPSTGKRTELDVGGGVPFVATAGQLWGAGPTRLWVVDTATGKLIREIPLAGSIEVMALAVATDAIWVGLRRPGRIGTVLKLNQDTGAVLIEYPVDIPARIEIGFGSAWVTDSGSSDVVRLPG